MVQVAKRNLNGSIKYCYIHDLLRDLAIRKANEDNILSVLLQHDKHTSLNTARRAAIHCSQSDELMKHINPNLRTLLCPESLPNYSRFKLLRVLIEIGGEFGYQKLNLDSKLILQVLAKIHEENGSEKMNFERLSGLTQLRYFESRNYCAQNCFDPPSFEAITHMKNVQTLDLSNLNFCNVPDCLWDVKILRHVILPNKYRGCPPGSADLKYLQTLINASVQNSWHINLPNIPNIRELALRVYMSDQHEIFANLISRLEHLVSLSIKSADVEEEYLISLNLDALNEDEQNNAISNIDNADIYYFAHDNQDNYKIEMYEMSVFPSYQHMHSLCLSGCLSMGKLTFDVSLFPIHLAKLTLRISLLELDPMPVLEKLKHLKKLKLISAYTEEEMTCSPGGFCQLKQLKLIAHQDLKKWVIMEGAMPVLQKLTLSYCHHVRIVGLNQVATLQEFSWDWPAFPSDDQEEKSEAIENQIKHVPIVNVRVPSKYDSF